MKQYKKYISNEAKCFTSIKMIFFNISIKTFILLKT